MADVVTRDRISTLGDGTPTRVTVLRVTVAQSSGLTRPETRRSSKTDDSQGVPF